MKWLSDLWKKQLEPAWEYRTSGLIWRLIPCEGLIIGEEREVEGKRVSLFCLDQATGAIQWEGVRLEEQWWVSIEGVHDDVVLVHEYSTPDLPEHKKIIALDVRTGRRLWASADAKLLFVHGHSLFAARDRFEDREFLEMKLQTGEIVRTLEPDTVNVLREMVRSSAMLAVDFPDTNEPQVPRRLIDKAIRGAHDVRFAEYLEKRGTLTVSYFDNRSADPGSNELEQHIVVLDIERENVIFSDRVHTGGRMPIPDTFFGINDFIYYVKDKRILRAVKLSMRRHAEIENQN